MVILSTIAVIFLTIVLFTFVIALLAIIANYKMFEKAGVEGWKAIIPFYNYYVMTKEVAKIDELWFYLTLLVFIPVLQIIAFIAIFNIHYSVVRRFSKESDVRILGTIFFPVFTLFAGFGSLKYDDSNMNKNGFVQDSTMDNIKGTTSSTSSSTSGATKFCKNCGNPIKPNDKFCQNCGNKL